MALNQDRLKKSAKYGFRVGTLTLAIWIVLSQVIRFLFIKNWTPIDYFYYIILLGYILACFMNGYVKYKQLMKMDNLRGKQ